jgi:hypothetical protein
MWGQGLRRRDRFSALFAAALEAELREPGKIVFDSSRSGAKIEPEQEDLDEFLDTYPHLFPGGRGRAAFRSGRDQSPAQGLYGEIPAPVPGVLHQVDMLLKEKGRATREIRAVLVTGGGNDIDVVDVIDSRNANRTYIERYDGLIRKFAHDSVLRLLKRIRQVCPNAVIMYLGLYPGLSNSSDRAAIRDYYKYENDNDVLWWLNEHVHTCQDVNQLINEAVNRAQWLVGRWTYWACRAVDDMCRDDATRGPGVLFVPSGFQDQHAGFAPNSHLHQDYVLPTSDAAHAERTQRIPRSGLLDDLRSARAQAYAESLGVGQFTRSEAGALRDRLDGPLALRGELDAYAKGKQGARARLLNELAREIHRIQHGLIASLAHPNEKGAKAYTRLAVERYVAHRRLVLQLERDEEPTVVVDGGVHTVTERTSALLARCDLRSDGSLSADIGHLNVDSVTLRVRTAADSDRNLGEPFFLVITSQPGGHTLHERYLLTFSPYARPDIFDSDADPIGKPYPYLEPGAVNRLTVALDGERHLERITGCYVLLGDDPHPNGSASIRSRYGLRWRPEEVQLEVNGRLVRTLNLFGQSFGPGDRVDFQWPAPAPVVANPELNAPAFPRLNPIPPSASPQRAALNPPPQVGRLATDRRAGGETE